MLFYLCCWFFNAQLIKDLKAIFIVIFIKIFCIVNENLAAKMHIICIYIHTYIYIYMCVCVCVCVCI